MTELRHIIASDFDGTLYFKDRGISTEDINTLKDLGQKKVIRLIATGRSLYSIQKVISDNFPIDYIVFSSGAGIYDCSKNTIIHRCNLDEEMCTSAFNAFQSRGLDFSIQQPVPDNHYFQFVKNNSHNPDFERRNKLYTDFSEKISAEDFKPVKACQLIACVPGRKEGMLLFEELKAELKELKVILSTSPIDHTSLWLEVFHPDVSKAKGVEILANKYGVSRENSMGIGNDYNDSDLLEWTAHSYILHHAPQELKDRFSVIEASVRSGFSIAADLWKDAIKL